MSGFRWIAVAPVALSAPAAYATTYLTVEQAQATMFPGERFEAAHRTLDRAQIAAIKQASGVAPLSPALRAWRTSSGGWLIVDRVVGKHEYIGVAVAIDRTGGVKSVEILDYRESYGGEVRNPKWRAQFVGKHAADPLKLDRDIKNISGATLSCKHVTDGVKRLLATHALVLAKG